MARAQVAGKSVLLYGWKLRALKKEFAEAVEEARKGSIWLGYEMDTLTLNEWYVIFIYIQDRKQYKDDSKDYFFKLLAKSGIVSILFDGITAYTVNRFYVVPLWLNNILHMCFLLSLDTFVFVMFRYLMEVTECVPRKKRDKIIYLLPFVINIGIVVLFITKLEYRRGKVTWYSM